MLSVAPTVVPSSGVISATASGFAVVQSHVAVHVTNTNGTIIVATLGAATLTNGSFGPVSFTIPSSVAPGAYRVQATDGVITATSTSTLTVVSPEQLQKYAISGSVQKFSQLGIVSTDNAIAGARVCATPSGKCVTTDSLGNYFLPELPPGPYEVKVQRTAAITFGPTARMVSLQANTTGVNFTGYDKPPVVLVHGIQNFRGSTFRCSDGITAYPNNQLFSGQNSAGIRDIADWVSQEGYPVYSAHLDSSPAATPAIEHNAGCLQQQVALVRHLSPNGRVILIAHSMGGLVARAYIESSRFERDVSILVTLGTPHLGTPLQGWLNLAKVLHIEEAAQDWVNVGLPCDQSRQVALCQMTQGMGIEKLNKKFSQRASGVIYYAVGGDIGSIPNPSNWTTFMKTLVGSLSNAVVIHGQANDGIVPTSSARGLSGSHQTIKTSEAHTRQLGLYDYFTAPPGDLFSLSYGACIRPVLRGNSNGCLESASARELQNTGPSYSALAPLVTGVIGSGQTVDQTVGLPGGDALLVATWPSGPLAFTLISPSGQTIDFTYAVTHASQVQTTASQPADTPQGRAYLLRNAEAGHWRMVLQAGSLPIEGVRYTLAAAMNSQIALTAILDHDAYTAGGAATLTATLIGTAAAATVTATISRPDGATDTVALTAQGNGVYRGSYTVPAVPGIASVRVTANGVDTTVPFAREAFAGFQIASTTFALSGSYSEAPELRGPGSPNYAAINVGIGVTANAAGVIGLSGDLVAGDGTVVAHAVTGQQTVAAGANTITLRFPGDAIAAADKHGPYTLTNLLLTDQRGATLVAAEVQNVATTAAYDYLKFVPRSLVFTTQPVKGVAGLALGMQPTVALHDGHGAVLTTASAADLTLRIKAGTGAPGAALLCASGQQAVTAAGVAPFSGCAIDVPGAGYVLEAVAGDAAAVESRPFDIGIAGDANGDCRVSIVDFSLVVTHFGTSSSSPGWNAPVTPPAQADLNGDLRVSVVDYSQVVSRFGRVCPTATLAPNAAAIGETVALLGSGFGNGATVDVALDGAPLATSPQPVTADGTGRIGVTFAMPAGLAPGSHVLKVSQPATAGAVTAVLTVP